MEGHDTMADSDEEMRDVSMVSDAGVSRYESMHPDIHFVYSFRYMYLPCCVKNADLDAVATPRPPLLHLQLLM
jgi:hypothetical protein